jgi:Acetyltransferase (GNAT) domain
LDGPPLSFAIRRATIEDGPGICRLFSRVFPREMTLEEWQWKYPRNPDGWLSVVAEVEGQIAGHYGGWGARVIMDGRETPLFSLCDLSTDPATRQIGGRHNMFQRMAGEWNELLRARGVPFSYGFPGPHAVELGSRLVGYRTHFPVREFRFRLGDEGLGSEAGSDHVGPSFDPLWEAARALIADSALVRDRGRVNWRYHARPDRYYRMVCAEESGTCVAWGVLSVLEGDALVMDYLIRDSSPELFERLWTALRSEAARMGARTLVFWEPPGGPWRRHLIEKLRRAGGAVAEAGYSFATAVLFDEEALARFVRGLHFTPSFYDDR